MTSSQLHRSLLSTCAGLGLIPEAMEMDPPKSRCGEIQPMTNGVRVKIEPEDISGSQESLIKYAPSSSTATNGAITAEAHKRHEGENNHNLEMRAWPFDHNMYWRGINLDNIAWADNDCRAYRPKQSKKPPSLLNLSSLLSPSYSSSRPKMDLRGSSGASDANSESVHKLYLRHLRRRVYQHCEFGTIHQFYRSDLELEILDALDKSKMPLNVKLVWYLEILKGDAFLGVWRQHQIDYNLPDDVIERYEPDMSLTSYIVPEDAPKTPTSKEVLAELANDVEGLQSTTDATHGHTFEGTGTTNDTRTPSESVDEPSEMGDTPAPDGAIPYALWAAGRFKKQLDLEGFKTRHANVRPAKAQSLKTELPTAESSKAKAKTKKRVRDYEEGSPGIEEGGDGRYDPKNSSKRLRRMPKSVGAGRKRKSAKAKGW